MTGRWSSRCRRSSSTVRVSRASGYNEFNQRAMLRLWADHLEMPRMPAPVAAVSTNNPNGIAPLVQTNRVPAAPSRANDKAATPS